MQIAFLGLGLIGGSVAQAVRAAPAYRGATLVAWTPSGAGPRAALDAGIVDAAASSPTDAVRGADLVILAAPPLACIRLIGDQAAELRGLPAPGATITDVASTKAALSRAAGAAGIAYVGGHPMAGREISGFEAADAALFRGRPWVVTEAVGRGDPGAVLALATACGAEPVELTARRHDQLVAGISHLPLLASAALVEAVTGARGEMDPDWPAAARLAASGWRDMTRLARGDTAMGAQIAVTNAEALAAVLRRYRDRIDAWLVALEATGDVDVDALRVRLDAARARLEDQSLPDRR